MTSVSVIIPALNEASNLSVLIPALLDMDHLGEIIIVEAAASEDELTINNEKVILLKSQHNSRAIQMNEGASHAKNDILCFLHADVKPHKDSFTTIIQKHKEGFLFGFFSYNFTPDNRWLRFNARFTRKDGWFAGGGDQVHFVDKKTFFSLGGYDEKFVIMEDFAFTRSIRDHKVPYCIIDLPALVSSRKYKTNSYLKVNVTNLIAVILFTLRIPSSVIQSWYRFMLSTEKT